MAITSIKRDEAYSPFIVRILSSNTLAEIGTSGYLLSQADEIAALNNGPFEWEVSDMVLVYASDGWGFFTVDPDFESFTAFDSVGGTVDIIGAPVVIGNFPVFQSTTGNIEDLGYLPSDATKTSVVMAGSAVVANNIAHFVDTAGTIDDTAANVTNMGDIYAGASGTAGALRAYPATAANGYLALLPVNAGGAFNTSISNSTMGQSSVISIPDPGTATSKFVLQDGVNTVLSVANLKYGATPVAQVDPASCTIVAAAGASNVSNVTIQLKDGSGTNMTRSIPFKVYASSASNGLTLAAAASTGFAVASGGVLDPTGNTTITQGISAVSSATGGCVLSLTDTAKQTSYLVLVLANGLKISAQLSAGSYGA